MTGVSPKSKADIPTVPRSLLERKVPDPVHPDRKKSADRSIVTSGRGIMDSLPELESH